MTAAVEIQGLRKTFGSGRQLFGAPTCCALAGVNLTVAAGERIALIGPSGSGKSTLLRHISGLIAADADGGIIRVFGKTVQQAGRISHDIRQQRASMGFIFQQFNLVGRLSLLANVLAGMLARVPLRRSILYWFTREEKQQAMAALDRVGLAAHAAQRASTLSGGQQQRGAIARAMVQGARILLADEPIASLDPEASRRVMESLVRLNEEDGVTLIISLHQVEYARDYFQRVVAMRDGRIVYDGPTAMLGASELRTIYGTQAEEMAMSWPDDAAPVSPTRRPLRLHSKASLHMAAAEL